MIDDKIDMLFRELKEEQKRLKDGMQVIDDLIERCEKLKMEWK